MNLAKRMERLGTETAFEVLAKARKLEQFSMWRSNTMGSVVSFEKGMNNFLKNHLTINLIIKAEKIFLGRSILPFSGFQK